MSLLSWFSCQCFIFINLIAAASLLVLLLAMIFTSSTSICGHSNSCFLETAPSGWSQVSLDGCMRTIESNIGQSDERCIPPLNSLICNSDYSSELLHLYPELTVKHFCLVSLTDASLDSGSNLFASHMQIIAPLYVYIYIFLSPEKASFSFFSWFSPCAADAVEFNGVSERCTPLTDIQHIWMIAVTSK